MPCIDVAAYGFYGIMRINADTHEIVESHSESNVDYMLDRVWDERDRWFESMARDIPTMDQFEFSHVPGLVIAYIALKKWNSCKAKSGGSSVPDCMNDVREVKLLIGQMTRRGVDDENFEQAAKFIRVQSRSGYGDALADVFDHPLFNLKNGSKNHFWVMANALKSFMDQNDGYLPVNGALSDMKSDSQSYISLQTL